MVNPGFFDKPTFLENGHSDISILETLRSEISDEERNAFIEQVSQLKSFNSKFYQLLYNRWQIIIHRIGLEENKAKELVKATLIHALTDYHLPRSYFTEQDIHQVHLDLDILFTLAKYDRDSQNYKNAYDSIQSILGNKKFEPVEKRLASWLTLLDKITAEQGKAFKALEILLKQYKEHFEKPRKEHEEFLSNEEMKFI
ncbi:hypothetical protein Lqui_2114 [Legionella quinlivanii]|uniref:Uncharacterized protein n=1 Tax=Legionella quinlivanii TaxID=45073 RepID=A0A0W0XTU9_9GAMM|nr:hypothetical protein [Legionella quinlivanii]KTD48072.1 hypothetical protein Lqui_2114 [Legionella quinlivanii]SEG48448.1 hypothetical protein SAMN02746093_03111 [Legionella quinlivanii DSM 21216]